MKQNDLGQIFEMLGDMREDIGRIEQVGNQTLAQAIKTNGRVNQLENINEKRDVDASYEKGFSKGRTAILTILGIFLGFLIGSVIIPIVASYIQTGKL